jgi:hypothetical protein
MILILKQPHPHLQGQSVIRSCDGQRILFLFTLSAVPTNDELMSTQHAIALWITCQPELPTTNQTFSNSVGFTLVCFFFTSSNNLKQSNLFKLKMYEVPNYLGVVTLTSFG